MMLHLFQSLTGRLQTPFHGYSAVVRVSQRFNPSQVGYKPKIAVPVQICPVCFNPSQVGYKLYESNSEHFLIPSFNPSQVGYKLSLFRSLFATGTRFNPSQVGYKLLAGALYQHARSAFQSLTGRLQTAFASTVRACNASFNPSQVGYKRWSIAERITRSMCFNPSQVGYKP